MIFDLIGEARARLSGVLEPTPVIRSSYLSGLLGLDCHLKLENLQKTGSFKARGAYNRIGSLTDAERARGVVAASSGNHAQGVAWAATALGVRSTVVMPAASSIVKQAATRGYGAELLLHGRTFAEAYKRAVELAEERGAVFIHPYDDDLVIAGQGTVGLEIIEQVPDVETVVVPVGGGGLISGVGSAIKGVRSDVKVIGAEAACSPACSSALGAGRPVEMEAARTMADGIVVKAVGERTLPIIRELVDSVVTVTEEGIAASIVALLERKKLVAEGAGAVPLAAAMEGGLPSAGRSSKVVFVVSGGNIDVITLERVIHLGLRKEGRITGFSTVIPDVPGSLARLSGAVGEMRGKILRIEHCRELPDVPVGSVRVEFFVEVESPEHSAELRRGLEGRGYALD